MSALPGGYLLLLLLLLDGVGVRAHADVALQPCDAVDPEQRWTLPADTGVAGNFVHESTGKCLMAYGCNDDPQTPLVLDVCAPSCLPQHKEAGTFIMQHHGRIVSQMMKQLVVHGGPPLALQTWTKATDPGQQWVVGPTGKPPGGAGHTLQIGKSTDGKGYQPHCPTDPCCLSTHYDIVPDGDEGWSLVVAVSVVSLLYICGGLHLGRRRGLRTHIHIEQSKQLWGLVQDGWAFARSRGRLRSPLSTTRAMTGARGSGRANSNISASGYSTDSKCLRATRGKPGPLHHAASIGDAATLQLLLGRVASRGVASDTGGEADADADATALVPEIDRGDHRQYTPFATACAGGHAACVSLLLEAGCNTSLLCDTGLTGWGLAKELFRAEVLALQPKAATAAAGGDGSGARSATKHRKQKTGSMVSARRSKRRQDSKGDGECEERATVHASATRSSMLVVEGEILAPLLPSRSPSTITL